MTADCAEISFGTSDPSHTKGLILPFTSAPWAVRGRGRGVDLRVSNQDRSLHAQPQPRLLAGLLTRVMRAGFGLFCMKAMDAPPWIGLEDFAEGTIWGWGESLMVPKFRSSSLSSLGTGASMEKPEQGLLLQQNVETTEVKGSLVTSCLGARTSLFPCPLSGFTACSSNKGGSIWRLHWLTSPAPGLAAC